MTQSELLPLEILRTLGIDGVSTLTPVRGGFDMAMWKVEHDGQAYALRVFRPGAHEDCERDLVPRYKHRPHELAPARRWTNKWKAQAGC